jgi:hypothetical protein
VTPFGGSREYEILESKLLGDRRRSSWEKHLRPNHTQDPYPGSSSDHRSPWIIGGHSGPAALEWRSTSRHSVGTNRLDSRLSPFKLLEPHIRYPSGGKYTPGGIMRTDHRGGHAPLQVCPGRG